MCPVCAQAVAESPRRSGPLGWLLKGIMLYIVLVVVAGTLINTGHPVAAEVGRILQTIMFVEPSIGWAESQGFSPLAQGLRMLSSGLPIAPLA